jgi:hypothetical protein
MSDHTLTFAVTGCVNPKNRARTVRIPCPMQYICIASLLRGRVFFSVVRCIVSCRTSLVREQMVVPGRLPLMLGNEVLSHSALRRLDLFGRE